MKVTYVNPCNDVFGGISGDKLVLGRKYEVDRVEVHGFHTQVYLQEFPEEPVGFNSVLFKESWEKITKGWRVRYE